MDIINIILLFIGTLFIILGLIIWKQQRVTLTFDLNSKSLKKEDRKAYAKSFGIAYSILGIAFMSVPVSNLVYNSRFQEVGFIIFLIAFIISMTIIIKTQVKYKTGLFN